MLKTEFYRLISIWERMKLLFTLTSGSEYSITRTDSTLIVRSSENEFMLNECIYFLKLMNYPIVAIEVSHYFYNPNFNHVMEFRQKLENMLIKKSELPVQANIDTDLKQASDMLLQMLNGSVKEPVVAQQPDKTFAPKFMGEQNNDVDEVQKEQDLLYLRKHISENKNIPDFKSNKSKDVQKSMNYIRSALGRRDIDHDYLRELQKTLVLSMN